MKQYLKKSFLEDEYIDTKESKNDFKVHYQARVYSISNMLLKDNEI